MGSGFGVVGDAGGITSGEPVPTAGGVFGGFTERLERCSRIRNVFNETENEVIFSVKLILPAGFGGGGGGGDGERLLFLGGLGEAGLGFWAGGLYFFDLPTNSRCLV